MLANLGCVVRGCVQSTGWDPEIFVVDKADKLIPAFEFLPDKLHPKSIICGQSAAYWDGFQAEFTTVPKQCHERATSELERGLRVVLHAARQKNPDAKFTLKNVFQLDQAFLNSTPSEYVELGCKPSMNAYGTDPFLIDNPYNLPYRMAGGHIHLGMAALGEREAAKHARYLDFIVGIPSVGMFAEIDDPMRRQFYGRAGEFRLPKHGIEYRTLSNAWLGHSAISNLIADMARYAVGSIENVDIKDFGTSHEEIRRIIDSSDVKAARLLFDKTKEVWAAIFRKAYNLTTKSLEKIVNEGVEALIPTYRNIDRNWGLTSLNGWMERGDGRWRDLVRS